MKFVKKIVPVTLSLAMCASLVAPALAASFTDLQDAINGTGGAELGNGRYGYAQNDTGYGIEAWDSEDGTRNVDLNEDVNYDKETDTSGIVISGKDVVLNMNGNTIDMNPGAALDVETGAFLDEDGNEVDAEDLNTGSVIKVNGKSDLTINGAGEDGEKGTITGGYREGNTAAGGGIQIQQSTVTLNDVSIEGNKAMDGGGIYVSGTYTTNVTANNVDITGNVATNTGGGIGTGGGSKSVTTLNNTNIVGNKADWVGGGISLVGGIPTTSSSTINMNSGVIANNTGMKGGDDVSITSNGTIRLPDVSSMKDENGNPLLLDEDGKAITGWYWDGGCAWGTDGDYAYYKYDDVNGKWSVGSLKAAHDEYFRVVYTDGLGTDLYETEVENNSGIPGFGGNTPDRDGYIFAGWQLLNGEDVDWENGVVNGTLTLVAVWTPEPEAPVTPTPGTGDTEIEIDDEAVPLAAGPVTRAEFVDYLWRHEGEPASDGVCTFADVAEDHEFILALAWAEQAGIITAYEDDTFEPDELVTVGAVQEFLANFARIFELDMDVYALTSLTGDEDEAVLNCDEVLAEFFNEELAQAA